MSILTDFRRIEPKNGNSANAPMIDLRHVDKYYQSAAGDYHALKDIALCICGGEFVSIIGKSGSGKSTLLNMITGIDRPTTGEVFVNGTAIHKMNENQLAGWRGENLGIIFQFFQLLPALNLMQNVILPMDLAGKYKPRERRERAEHLLETVGLAEQMHKLPSMVSGGQQQRAAIARALANDPLVLIADEPTGNLDPDLSAEIVQIFSEANLRGSTVLLATHDRELIRTSGRRCITLEHGRVADEKARVVEHRERREGLFGLGS